ncbi:MAG: outer membrane protein assembly factor [Vicinamibacterales bacterium]
MVRRILPAAARVVLGALLGALVPAVSAAAQTPDGPAAAPRICGVPVPPPAKLPPEGSGPVIYFIAPCFEKQGNVSAVEPQTYLYYIHTKPSLPSQDVWQPWDDTAIQSIQDDFKRLWATSFLEDLSIETQDYLFTNGVVGKLVTYQMEERERVKMIDYEGSKLVERTKIDEKLRELNVAIPTDSFRDDAKIRRAESVIRSFMADKGHNNAEVSHKVVPIEGGPKLVKVVFTVSEGPKVRIQRVEFVGNTAMSDGALEKRMKTNKGKKWYAFFSGKGTFKADKYEEDIERVGQFYRNQGFVQARIGAPEMKTIRDSADGKTRWIELRIPVTEGPRFRVGDVAFEGNTIVKSEGLRPLFRLQQGEYYNEEAVRKGLEKAREIYGSVGYWEFTGYPDTTPRDTGIGDLPGQVPPILSAIPPTTNPIVDVTMRLQEGKQYFVNKITFTGNTTTRDNVIRREIQLGEGGVFNTESLKYSVRRLNQLGYFKQLDEQKAIDVQKTPGKDNAVDLTLKLEEQNRNQISFGAGMSQFEGFFGQLSFQTANFLGRGESLTVSMTAGSRSRNYQLAFTEPFLFDRNLTVGFDIFSRTLQYISQFTQASTGGNTSIGFPVGAFSRTFVAYSYEQVKVQDLNEAFFDSSCLLLSRGCSEVNLSNLTSAQALLLQRNPFLYDSLLVGQSGKRTVSKITPSFVHNTIDNPIFPNRGKRLTLSLDMAGVGGNTKYLKPTIEGVFFRQHTGRTSYGGRAQFQYIRPYSPLPIFERIVLGGDYTIRGFDLRTIGPTAPNNPNLILGGNKSIVLNAEYLINIAGPVRLVLFYDTGQVRDIGQSFSMKEDLTELRYPDQPLLFDPFASSGLVDPNAPGPTTVVLGRTSAWKTSTGAEIRFFMPVLNVPFRLIFAANPQRAGVLSNSLRPAKDFVFRFSVGSTF